jgi:hypothetical protein
MKKSIVLSFILMATTIIAIAASSKSSITVKKIEADSESGDGFIVYATNGKSYYVYNAGGEQHIPGEKFIKKGAKLCLSIESDTVSSVSKGSCK